MLGPASKCQRRSNVVCQAEGKSPGVPLLNVGDLNCLSETGPPSWQLREAGA